MSAKAGFNIYDVVEYLRHEETPTPQRPCLRHAHNHDCGCCCEAPAP
jgi:hypothetical protein